MRCLKKSPSKSAPSAPSPPAGWGTPAGPSRTRDLRLKTTQLLQSEMQCHKDSRCSVRWLAVGAMQCCRGGLASVLTHNTQAYQTRPPAVEAPTDRGPVVLHFDAGKVPFFCLSAHEKLVFDRSMPRSGMARTTRWNRSKLTSRAF